MSQLSSSRHFQHDQTTWLYRVLPRHRRGRHLKLLQGGALDGEAIKARSNMITIRAHVGLRSVTVPFCAERSRIKLAT